MSLQKFNRLFRSKIGLHRYLIFRRLRRGFIFFLLAISPLATGCRPGSPQPFQESEILLGTFVTITTYDTHLEEAQVREAVDSAFAAMRGVEEHFNVFDPNSEVGKMNQASNERQTFSVSEDFRALAMVADSMARLTQGAFDYTLWPVFRLWHFGTDSARVPSAVELQKYLPLVDYRLVRLEDHQISFRKKGMALDFSGISKGFAVERAREVLLQYGLKNFIIDAGGNLGIEWHRSQPVQVLIRHPRKSNAFWGRFPVQTSCGVATSGDYQNFFEQGGKRYHHILNPHTGLPVDSVVSVTFLASEAISADALSTAVFVMGPHKGLQFIEQQKRLEAIIVYPVEGKLQTLVSSGLKNSFQFQPDESAH